MNKLIGVVTQVQQSGAILLVDMDVNGHSFSALLIESLVPPPWLQEGRPVAIVFKETEVSLAKGLSGQISMRNRIKGNVLEVERGVLLSRIMLKFQHYTITSAVTTRAVDALHIKVGDGMEAMVKANEISIMRT